MLIRVGQGLEPRKIRSESRQKSGQGKREKQFAFRFFPIPEVDFHKTLRIVVKNEFYEVNFREYLGRFYNELLDIYVSSFGAVAFHSLTLHNFLFSYASD